MLLSNHSTLNRRSHLSQAQDWNWCAPWPWTLLVPNDVRRLKSTEFNEHFFSFCWRFCKASFLTSMDFQIPILQSLQAKSTNQSGMMWGESAGVYVCGVGGKLCQEVTGGGGSPSRLWWWVLENEAGCKRPQCRVCQKSFPSGDEGGGSCMAQRRSVTCFG